MSIQLSLHSRAPSLLTIASNRVNPPRNKLRNKLIGLVDNVGSVIGNVGRADSKFKGSWARNGDLGLASSVSCRSMPIFPNRSPRRKQNKRNGVIVAESVANVNNAGSGWWDKVRGAPPRLSDVVWPAAGAFVAMAIMGMADRMIAVKGLTLTIAPFGAVCAVLFAAPSSPAAQEILGVITLALFGPGWIARSVSLAASVAFMIYTGSFHPPAAGMPLLFIDVPRFQHLQWWYSIFPGAAGCVLLCLMVIPPIPEIFL
eukprot:Gb_31772 [translate_table: standard]